jgi:hypothetical protein
MTEVKILTIENCESILTFEKSRLPGEDFEREMATWHARWRKEALEHYLPLGWSFCKRKDGEMVAYILCQPLLFFEGWTQSLWIEHVSALHPEDAQEMIEIAYRWARDKHLQKVFFNTQLDFIKDTNVAQTHEPIELGSFSSTKLGS